jgi:hypothetical protein
MSLANEFFYYQHLSLYIPRVFPNISAEQIKNVFESLNYGKVFNVELVPRSVNSNGESSNMAFVHFTYWYYTPMVCEFQRKVLNTSEEARIIYDDPYYWIVLPNKTAKHPLDLLLERVVDLESSLNTMKNKSAGVSNYQNNVHVDKEPEMTNPVDIFDINPSIRHCPICLCEYTENKSNCEACYAPLNQTLDQNTWRVLTRRPSSSSLAAVENTRLEALSFLKMDPPMETNQEAENDNEEEIVMMLNSKPISPETNSNPNWWGW